jgi:hypothetical protein
MIGWEKEEIIGRICHTYVLPGRMGRCPITDLATRLTMRRGPYEADGNSSSDPEIGEVHHPGRAGGTSSKPHRYYGSQAAELEIIKERELADIGHKRIGKAIFSPA